MPLITFPSILPPLIPSICPLPRLVRHMRSSMCTKARTWAWPNRTSFVWATLFARALQTLVAARCSTLLSRLARASSRARPAAASCTCAGVILSWPTHMHPYIQIFLHTCIHTYMYAYVYIHRSDTSKLKEMAGHSCSI